MAQVTLTNISAATGGATSVSSPNTGAFALAAGEAAILTVSAENGAGVPAAPTITQAGATWSLVYTVTLGTGGSRLRQSCYICLSASGFASAVINIDFGGSTQNAVTWHTQKLDNHYAGGTAADIVGRQTAKTAATANPGGTSITPTLLVALHHANNVVIGSAFVEALATFTGPSGWTSLSNQTATNQHRSQVWWLAGSDLTAEVSWSSTLKGVGGIVELRSEDDTDASTLGVDTQPAGAVNNVAFATQPRVQIRDSAGNPVAQAGVLVSANILTGTGTIGGTTSATSDSTGLAIFTSLKIVGTQNHTLQFTASGLTAVNSANFFVYSAGPGTQVVFYVQPPTSAQSSVAIAPTIQARIHDASNIPLSTAGTDITMAIGTHASEGTLGGTATKPTTAPEGAATFGAATALSIALAASSSGGNYFTLVASSLGLTPATSNIFVVTPQAGGGGPLLGEGTGRLG